MDSALTYLLNVNAIGCQNASPNLTITLSYKLICLIWVSYTQISGRLVKRNAVEYKQDQLCDSEFLSATCYCN